MGCDIHIVTEIKKDGKWQYVPEIPESLDNRNYTAFAVLADVRNYFNYKGFQPKGLPEDISAKKFDFRSDREFLSKLYHENGSMMLVTADGKIQNIFESNTHCTISEEEYNRFNSLSREEKEKLSSRYYCFGYSNIKGEKTYSVYDATVVGGEFKEIPYMQLYPTFDDYLRECHDDSWDVDAQDYGSWHVNFEQLESGDYHSASHLTLNELLNGNYEDYITNRYKMDREFYNVFVENGGTFPDMFRVVGNTEAGDFAEAMREAFSPTVVIAWKKSEEEQKKLAIFRGIEELTMIAEKYGIVNYNDIRIVFAFDN